MMVASLVTVLASALIYTVVDTLPVREKISINTDMLAKVREQSNSTGELINNFARRITVKITTVTTIGSVTSHDPGTVDPIEDMENDKIYVALSYTLADPYYRKLWVEIMAQKGYNGLIEELKHGGPEKFAKRRDDTYDGPQGEYLWKKTVQFLYSSGEKGFQLVLASVDQNAEYMFTKDMV